VRGSRRRNDRIDESRSPERGDAERGEEIIIAGRQKQAVPASADPPPAPPHTLQEGSDRGRSVDLHHPVEIADVDAELERARRDNDAVGLGRELLDARRDCRNLSVRVGPGVFRIRDQPVDRPPLDLVGRPRSLISGGLSRACARTR
jgi:hypothetical protein